MSTLSINKRQYLELEKIALGAFAPLTGFMTEQEFHHVVAQMRLPGGEPFPLPVVLDVTEEEGRRFRHASRITLVYEGQDVGELAVDSVYTCEKERVAEQVFGTSDAAHPGVAHFHRMGAWFVGGPVRLFQRVAFEFSPYELTPEVTRAAFKERGWQTVVGFQTRNVPHRAHEYLLRVALEQADGVFIQPLVGYKKRGDFHPLAILAGYRTLIEEFLPPGRALLGVLSTAMRYAGPREAVFHAIIRRNYGCTHFIVGRDHAGVGDYYGRYDAHALTRAFDGQLGIHILQLHGPFYCRRCDGIVTERTCPHAVQAPEATQQISGTMVRTLLSQRGEIPQEVLRPEGVASILGGPLFIEEDEE